jgi:hypothetical protein
MFKVAIRKKICLLFFYYYWIWTLNEKQTVWTSQNHIGFISGVPYNNWCNDYIPISFFFMITQTLFKTFILIKIFVIFKNITYIKRIIDKY